MRTSANLFVGSGVQKFAQLVRESAKGCPVCVIFDIDPYETALAIKQSGLTVKLVPLDKASVAMNYRFYVGLGSERAAERARELADGDKKYALYCDFLGAAAFSGGSFSQEEPRNYAEFAYFDANRFPLEEKDKYLAGTLNLLTLATALVDKAAMTVLYPVRDVELEITLTSVKNFFAKRVDKDKYLSSLLSLIKSCTEYATANNLNPVATAIKERLKREITAGLEFFIDYILLYLCIIFTKWDFFDMLIPAENLSGLQPFQERLILASADELKLLFFQRQDLRTISKTLRGMGLEVSNEEMQEVFAVLNHETALSGGFYAVVSLMGLIDGLFPAIKHT